MGTLPYNGPGVVLTSGGGGGSRPCRCGGGVGVNAGQKERGHLVKGCGVAGRLDPRYIWLGVGQGTTHGAVHLVPPGQAGKNREPARVKCTQRYTDIICMKKYILYTCMCCMWCHDS